MDIALSFAGLIAVGVKIVSVLKFVEAKDWKSLQYQVAAWVVFIALAFWGANIQGIENTVIGDIELGDMTAATLLYVGFALGSTGSLAVDVLKAIDNKSTTKV